MIREHLMGKEAAVQNGFRLRGLGETSRVEALSDGVIAFAITLLVVSLEVPRTFDDLLVTMRGFVAFAITFAMLFHVWHTQYRFFRRYGLNDNFTIWMTALLLFVVLFYVYPLKFVWTLFVNNFTGVPTGFLAPDGTTVPAVRREQVPLMMSIFGLGFAAVFAVFTLLYHHAYRRRGELELSELETFDTRTFAQENALNVGVGLLSVAIAACGGARFSLLSGLAYWLIGPAQFIHGYARGRRRKRLEQDLPPEAGSPLDAPAG
ncbi:MAG TPA: TMEM175 family protein [Pyrinomonadaceae bacterium]